VIDAAARVDRALWESGNATERALWWHLPTFSIRRQEKKRAVETEALFVFL
jgi:hypothetical protein